MSTPSASLSRNGWYTDHARHDRERCVRANTGGSAQRGASGPNGRCEEPTADWDDRAYVVTQNAPGDVAGPERTCKESLLVVPSNASSVLSVLSQVQLSQNLRQLPTPVCDGRPLRSGIAITPLHSVTVLGDGWSPVTLVEDVRLMAGEPGVRVQPKVRCIALKAGLGAIHRTFLMR